MSLMSTWKDTAHDVQYMASKQLSVVHCKNKLVILTTEWLPWLQSSWRDSGYERFALV